MKFSFLPLLTLSSLSSITNGFTITPIPSVRNLGLASTQTPFFAEEESTSAVEPSIYDKVGFAEEKMAIGLDPEDVLEYLGTRDQLIERFDSDNPKFDRERATEEVDRFIMDGEMVARYIAFEKNKRNPTSLREEAEANLSDPKTWATYVAWIGGGAGFALVRNKYINPKYESGEWEEIHIKLPTWFGGLGDPNDAVESVSQAVDTSAVTDTVQSLTDSM